MSDIVALQKQIKDLERRLRIREREQGRPPTADSAWQSPSFTNSWVDYSAGFQTARYRLNDDGLVELQGLIKDGTISAAAFTLPAKYRPAAAHIFVTYTSTGVGRLNILSNGQVVPAAGSNVFFSISGIVFRPG